MSALDGRIRHLAREEATALLGVGHPSGSTDGTADLQRQITDLHEHLHHAATTIKRLEDRVDKLEKAPAAAARRRAVGKTSGPEGNG
jgi:hypothetical protein